MLERHGPNNAGVPAPVARNSTVAQGIVIDGLAIMLSDTPDSASIPDLDSYYKEWVIGGEGGVRHEGVRGQPILRRHSCQADDRDLRAEGQR
ncbi:DUF1194 domain-containing protein [Sinorhizobium fredii]|uniref:DUF1194 domain-containing protein n=1 Tax=Rhizobium fredii TaxID=380 RepID=UPI001CC2404A|nr:DUF1194 domain-containing protein [Sinorhizobium fredii]